jgi:hypothetical protein
MAPSLDGGEHLSAVEKDRPVLIFGRLPLDAVKYL